MPVAYDNSSRAEANFVSSLSSGAFTISGADRVMVICVAAESTTINTPTASTGTPAAISNASSAVNRPTSLYRVIAPATGSQSATAQFANADGTSLVCVAVTFTGADQTTPCQNGTNTSGNSAAPSLTVPSVTADDFVIDCCWHGGVGGTQGDPGAGQTERGTSTGGFAAVSTQDGVDGGVMSWTSSEALVFDYVATRVVAAAAGGGNDLSVGHLGEPVIGGSTF